jgi:oligopeptide transport system substrate-binding protein
MRWISIFLLLAACFSSQQAPQKSAILRLNAYREPLTLDPRQGSEMVGSTLHFMLFEGLTRLNPDGTIIPAQAKSIEISDDRLTYTFHLRGTKWSDGSLVTALDFEKAWKKILTPDFPAANAHLFAPIKNAEKAKQGLVSQGEVGIHAQDSQTLIVHLERPTPYFLELISFCVFFPVHHEKDEADPHWMEKVGPLFVSNGPFALKAWKRSNEIVLEKNPFYWEAPHIALNTIHIAIVPHEATVLNMYENGEIDMLGLGLCPIPNDILARYHQLGLLKTYATPGTTILSLNVDKFPFHNRSIRHAFALAIHRQEIVDNVTQLGEEIATDIIPPCLRKKPPLAYFKDHDVEKALALFHQGLGELNLSQEQFPPITYYYSPGGVNHKLAQVLQEQLWQTLGVELNLRQVEHKVLLDILKQRAYELAQTFWVAQYKDPISILERVKFKRQVKNYPGWENQDYIRLLEQSAYDKTAAEREKTLESAEALLVQEMPLIPLYHWKTGFLIKETFDYQDFPESGFLELTRISLKDVKK